MDPVRIDVPTPSRAYAITIVDGAIDRLPKLLDELKLPERRFVVSSAVVWRFHGNHVARAIGMTGIQFLNTAQVRAEIEAILHE